jgi:hypothetical protein
MKKKIRTDLALEARESFPEDDVEIKGVELTEDYDEEKKIRVSTVVIKDEKGAKAMQKPIGTYITIEAPDINKSDENYHKPVSDEIAKHLKKLAGNLKREEVLVVGLGNREVTPDALGPQVVIIKKGEHGALMFTRDKYFVAPSFPLEEVRDPTGAGDTFAGGVLGYLAFTDDLSEANMRKAIIMGPCWRHTR